MIPLASDLIPFPGQMRREGHLKYANLPDRLSSSSRAVIVGTLCWKCPVIPAVLQINPPLVWQSSHSKPRIGKSKGETIEIEAPGGAKVYKIQRVEWL